MEHRECKNLRIDNIEQIIIKYIYKKWKGLFIQRNLSIKTFIMSKLWYDKKRIQPIKTVEWICKDELYRT